jgi:hypothetical protein
MTIAAPHRLALALALAASGAALLAGCGRQERGAGGVGAVAAAAPIKASAAQTSPCLGFGVPPIVQQPVLTGDFSTLGDQTGADCMAWQSFIALNWAADPANPGLPDPTKTWADFGSPAETGQTVWESYHEASAVFAPPGGGAKLLWSAPRNRTKQLFRDSKFDDTDLSLRGFKQAGDDRWLTAQSGNLTYYEVKINQDEFEFITSNVLNGNNLTTFAGQQACAQAGQNGNGGFSLPVGGGSDKSQVNDYTCTGQPRIYGQNVGAIEIKAAWTALPADGSLDYRYLTSRAQIKDPLGNVSTATVGLVGLHIIRRVPGAPQFVWSTFEHVDNGPDQSSNAQRWVDPILPANPNLKPRSAYTYFNPNCVPSTDPYGCEQNSYVLAKTKQAPKPCDKSGLPAGCVPYSAPMQITRVTPVDNKANAVTGYVWSLLPANSVFNYYRLINVQWPAAPSSIDPGAPTPLTMGDITPANRLANTTLETYLQSTGCMTCHQSAPIASRSAQTTALTAGKRRQRMRLVNFAGTKAASTPSYASSYSFLFATETNH